MRGLLLLLALVVAALVTIAEPLGPRAELATPLSVLGARSSIDVTASDRGTGLSRIELRVTTPTTPAPIVLAEQTFPRRSWYGSGVHETTIAAPVDAATARVPEGPATLEVWVHDHSWLDILRRGPRLTQAITIDLTPPGLEVMSKQHRAQVGGSECLVYKVSADTTASGVRVGDAFFPGTAGLFADPALRAALFAIPDAPAPGGVVAEAVDAAGNRRTANIDLTVKSRRFPEKTLTIDDAFLQRKVPELLREMGLPATNDLVQGYLTINRDGRKATETRVREICREGSAMPQWAGGLLRMPNSAPLSGFADRRTYLHATTVIDHQTHLGFDLASLRMAEVPAAAAGRVAFTGFLGIYGTTVILDHGMGLYTLYGHLSSTALAAGATVARGDILGKTGETGLAGGDHLHFSVMIRGIHVDPVEWWDGHWIQDHVDARLAEFPRRPAEAVAGKPS